MFGIFGGSFDSLDENDLRDLVERRRVREHTQLEYKRDAYKHDHDGAVEMLADITAMANAQGGYILIGIEEDKQQPDGTPSRIVGIENGDTEASWIHGLCQGCIDEKISGLRVREIGLSSGMSCLAISVPNSPQKPHLLAHQKHRSFRMRHGREKNLMNMSEVRNMILSMSSYRANLEEFLASRKMAFAQWANGEPCFAFMATPIYSESEKVDPLRQDIRDVLTKAPGCPDPREQNVITSGPPIPTLEGVEANIPQAAVPERFLQSLRASRNGHIEYWHNFVKFVPTGWPVEAMPIPTYGMAVYLITFLEMAKRIYSMAEINEPIAVSTYWLNYRTVFLNYRNNDAPDTGSQRSFPMLPIEFTVSNLEDTHAIAQVAINRLFNAFGYEKSTHFDTSGRLILMSSW